MLTIAASLVNAASRTETRKAQAAQILTRATIHARIR